MKMTDYELVIGKLLKTEKDGSRILQRVLGTRVKLQILDTLIGKENYKSLQKVIYWVFLKVSCEQIHFFDKTYTNLNIGLMLQCQVNL